MDTEMIQRYVPVIVTNNKRTAKDGIKQLKKEKRVWSGIAEKEITISLIIFYMDVHGIEQSTRIQKLFGLHI